MIKDYTLKTQLNFKRDLLTDVKIEKGFNVRPLWKTMLKLHPNEMIAWVDRFDSLCPVASEWALAQAFESAFGILPNIRNQFVRSIFCEINRLIWLMTYLGRVVHSLGQNSFSSQAYTLREQVFSIQEELTGSRILPQVLQIGGSRRQIALGDVQKISSFLGVWAQGWKQWKAGVENDPVVFERLSGLMVIPHGFVTKMSWWGIVGKASGWKYDSRKHRPHGAYAFFDFDIPEAKNGDAWSRLLVAMKEVDLTLHLLNQLVAQIPMQDQSWKEPIIADKKMEPGFYSGYAEAAKGPVIAFVHVTEKSEVASVRIFSAGQRTWPILDSLFENILAEEFEPAYVSLGIDAEDSEL